MTRNFEQLARLFRGVPVRTPTAAHIWQCSLPTARKKLRDPGEMELWELVELVKAVGLTDGEVARALNFVSMREKVK